MAGIITDGLMVKDYNGTQIYLSDGSFYAKIAGKWVKRAKQGDLEKEIAKNGSPIQVMEVNTSYIGNPNIVTILSVEPSKDGRSWGKYRLDSGKTVYTGQSYYAVNDEFIEKAREIKARKEAADKVFQEEWRQLCGNGLLRSVKEGDITNMLHAARIAAERAAEGEGV